MMFKRKQLIELHEQAWMPKRLRNIVTDFIGHLQVRYHIYANTVPLLHRLLEKTPKNKITDLCSGSAAQLLQIQQQLKKDYHSTVAIELTDKYPNIKKFKAITEHSTLPITYLVESVDALYYQGNHGGIRTLFTAFHHFNPDDAKHILQNSVAAKEPIAIFEFTENKPMSFFKSLLIPFSTWVLMPSVKPFKWTNLLFTYVIPVAPLIILWDAVVSSLRTYDVKELNQLTQNNHCQAYHWETGKLPTAVRWLKVTYLLGYPKEGMHHD